MRKRVALEAFDIIMVGNALFVGCACLVRRHHPGLSVGAADLGLGVKHFREKAAAGRLPARERYGEWLIWDKRVLDHHVNKDNSRHRRTE